VIDLERALTDLAEHLDVPNSHWPDDANWQVALAAHLTEPSTPRRHARAHALLAAAAAAVVLAAGVLTVAPARRAVAGWLGIGAVEIRQSAPPPSPTSTTRPSLPPVDLATARGQVQFEISTPQGAGDPSRVTVDRRVPGGLVTLTYDHFTLVEIASEPSEPVISKFVDGGRIESVGVQGYPALWIADAHSIGFIDRSGRLQPGTLRKAGPVLVWARGGVTYRIEGPHRLAEAMAIADTMF
jgi:hypothetical protein